ncbi:MAG: hypothetical protein U0Q16_37400 [Bryobacteraceae bacterium]
MKLKPWQAAAVLFLANVLLFIPVFLPGDPGYRDSIEPGYASMARVLSESPSPFAWNPWQYCGLPMQMWYLPVIPYLGALAIKLLPFLEPGHAYRLLVVTLTCLQPVTMFAFVRYFTRSTKWALISAAIYTFLSPAYALYPAAQLDAGIAYMPWRMQTLIKYGEGPHNTGLMLIPLVLVACWRAAIGRRFGQILIAAIALAAVCLTNWVAALSLAWCVLMMLTVGAGAAAETGFLHRRVFQAAILGYLLAAFWLTPRFVGTTLFNWPADAFGYAAQIHHYLLMAPLILVPIAIRIAFLRYPAQWYPCWLAMCGFGFLYVALIHYRLGVDVIPESRRYAIESEWFLIALAVEIARRLLPTSKRDWVLVLAGVMLPFSFEQARLTAMPVRLKLAPVPRSETIEWRMAEKVAEFHPSGRVHLLGGTRFRFNSWFSLPQTGGTFESGLINRDPFYLTYQILRGIGSKPGRRSRDSMLLLRTLGVEYAVIHGPKSREHWRDMKDHEQLAETLPAVFHEEDDTIYKVPFKGFANLIRPEEIPARLPVGADTELAESYVAAMDAADHPSLAFQWRGNSRFEIRGAVPEGFWVATRVAYDGGWQATQDGSPIAVERDTPGFVLLKPKPSPNTTLVVEFGITRERRLFWSLSAGAWLAALTYWLRARRK